MRRGSSGVRSKGPHQCRAKGALGGEVTPGHDGMPAMLLYGLDGVAAMTRSNQIEHLNAAASSRQELLLLNSAKGRNDERSGAKARLDVSALDDGGVRGCDAGRRVSASIAIVRYD